MRVLVGTHRMPSIHPDQLKAEAAEAAELLKKLKACMNPEHNPSRYLRTHGVLVGVLVGYS